MLSEQRVVWILISQRTNKSLTIFGCLWEACGDFRYAWLFCGSVQRFSYAVLERSIQHFGALWQSVIISVSEQHVVRALRTLAKFESAVLVDVYHCLKYAYIDILVAYSLRTKHTTFLCSTASLCSSKFLSFSHDRPDSSNSRATFQLTGRYDLIGSSRSLMWPPVSRKALTFGKQ